MGYNGKGKKWSDQAIINEIINVTKILNIKYMPSKSEMDLALGNSALSNAINKRGGFKVWANKVNLKMKSSDTKLGDEWEYKIKNVLEEMGYKVDKMSTRHPYDLLINDNIKIDIKVSNLTKYNYFTFNLSKPYHNCDIFICVCVDENEILKTLIIPSKILMGIKQLSVGINSEYDYYNNKYDYIKQYNDFYEAIN